MTHGPNKQMDEATCLQPIGKQPSLEQFIPNPYAHNKLEGVQTEVVSPA